MASNVFEQTIEKEVHIASNQIACTILEHLMPYTDASILERFQQAFSSTLRPICSDKFASHILQKMVEVSFLRAVSPLQKPAVDPAPPANKKRKADASIPDEKQYNLQPEHFDDDHRQKCSEFVVKISKFLLNNLEDFVWDAYACHVIRTCLMCLCGLFVYKQKDFISSGGPHSAAGKHPIAEKETALVAPSEWTEIIQEYAARLQAWPQFPELPYDDLSSGLLQSLCLALRTVDKSELKHLGKRILNDSFISPVKVESSTTEDKSDIKPSPNAEYVVTTSNLPKVFSSESSIRLLEAILAGAGPKLMTQLYAKLFQGRLIELGEMRSANFTVQKLLEHIKTKEDFEAVFDEMAAGVESLLRIGHTGVVNALAFTCLRLGAKQGAFVQSLQTALHCTAPKEHADRLAVLTMKLKPYEVAVADKSNFVHLHGSLILQSMLQFNKPIKLVQSLLDTKPEELAELFSGPRGSHVVDAFITSKFIGEKSREKFIKHMNGNFLEMAISRHGSRAVEAMFEASGENQRVRIVKELADKVNQLNGSPTGRLLNYKFRVDTYRLSPEQWKNSFSKESKAEKLFKDIIQ